MADRNQGWGRSYQDWDQDRDRFDERSDYDQPRGSRYTGASYGRNLEDDYTQGGGRGDYGGGAYGANYGGGRYGDREQGWGRRNVGRDTWGGDAGRNYGSSFGASDDYDRYAGSRNDDERYRTASRGYGARDEDRRGYGDRNAWDRTRDEVSSWFGDDDAERRRRMDERREERTSYRTGDHRGKGPKGYRRSEERIREDVCERLSYDDRLDASNIDVRVQGDEVVLTGTVHDREQKHRAEDLVESISGVRNVENNIKVDRGAGRQMHDYTGNTDEVGGIGRESGTTNELIRDTQNDKGRRR